MAAGLDVHICRDPGEFAALAPQWARLHRACPRATPFQSHGWLYSWWLWYGRPGRLRIVLVRRGGDPAGEGTESGGQGELVGAFALMRTYRPLPALVPLGGAVTDFSDALVDPGAGGEAVAAALVRGMRRASRGSLVDLGEVPPGGAAGRLYDLWPGPKRMLADSECLELPGGPMSELIARVGSSRGQRIRSNLRKIDAAGIQEHDVPAADVPAAVATMLRLHAAQWEGRGVTPEHLRPRFAAHLSHACALMTESGEALLTEFRLRGAVVAVNLTVLSPALAGGYLYGADLPALSAAKVDLNTLLTRHGARLTSAADRPVHSMLRGAEPHKSHWRPVPTSNTRLLLSTRRSLPSLLTRRALAALRAALRELRRRRRSREAPAGKAAPATRHPHRPPDGSSR
ncbi:Acetyltransferase involved in cellulose biosynthesis, CelD/BcsL family [Actinacidiphila yanglinensis]|uniref:Acetyltransferase involved in cellulose biosynthesis, CelD/BcsL family n=1 Tax=Actinacidiphila yanglinensis TaxID=310779 RepID=A0A1H6AEC8_9ACTN|nr:GNAT family N-acetyltransferase [Actinacidiphila yanglinensis]SEG47129.1 Acetyltransferase involved in cellulose biosynthesis, CelD/BcsL family [Actinacidiphila yanglinensis]